MEVIYVAGATSALLCTFIFDQLSLDILPVVQFMGKDREEDWREADQLFNELMWNRNAGVTGEDLNGSLRAASFMAVSPRSIDSGGLFLFVSMNPWESNGYPGKTLLWGMSCHINVYMFLS